MVAISTTCITVDRGKVTGPWPAGHATRLQMLTKNGRKSLLCNAEIVTAAWKSMQKFSQPPQCLRPSEIN